MPIKNNNLYNTRHLNINGHAECGILGGSKTKYTKLVTCKKCKMKIVFRTNPWTRKPQLTKVSEIKANSISDEGKEEIFLDFLSGGNNSQKELAVKHNTTPHKIAAIITQKFAEKNF